jgi:hypothetical protein
MERAGRGRGMSISISHGATVSYHEWVCLYVILAYTIGFTYG